MAETPARTSAEGSEPSAITPNEFEGSDAERINRAIEAAAAAGGRVVIPRVNFRGAEQREVWLLDSAILLRSNVTLVLDNCRLKLSDRCRDNFMRSANCGIGITEIQPLLRHQPRRARDPHRRLTERLDHQRRRPPWRRTRASDAGVRRKEYSQHHHHQRAQGAVIHCRL